MLKIKDNVELKKLKKFGFVYYDSVGQYKLTERNILGTTYIYINAWNRKILYRQDIDDDKVCLSKLYDLITADLVEKVDD